jgi:hypothetical protein
MNFNFKIEWKSNNVSLSQKIVLIKISNPLKNKFVDDITSSTNLPLNL